MNIILLYPDEIQGDQAIIGRIAVVRHILQTLKSTIGDTLKVGELGGNIGKAVIAHIDESSQQVILDELVLDRSPPPKLPITVILALPRPKVLRRLIIDMSAIGVEKIVLINSVRTEKSYWQSPLLQQIDTYIEEGLSQGMDTIAPIIRMVRRFRPFVEDELAQFDDPIMLAHPYNALTLSDYQKMPRTVIIGAEGGFVPFEVELLTQNGATAVSMGERILRTEAAVNAILGRFLG